MSEQSETPRTDALYFPFGEDSTMARSVSFLEGLNAARTLERELSEVTRERDEGRHELGIRQNMTATTRLHNICRGLEDQKNDSPYSTESWDQLTAENDEMSTPMDTLDITVWTCLIDDKRCPEGGCAEGECCRHTKESVALVKKQMRQLSALAAAERELDELRGKLEEAQRLIKNLAPTGRYNGLDIEGWYLRATSAEYQLKTDALTQDQLVAGGNVLWEKQFEGSPWKGRVKLIDPSSMGEYQEVAANVYRSMRAALTPPEK